MGPVESRDLRLDLLLGEGHAHTLRPEDEQAGASLLHSLGDLVVGFQKVLDRLELIRANLLLLETPHGSPGAFQQGAHPLQGCILRKNLHLNFPSPNKKNKFCWHLSHVRESIFRGPWCLECFRRLHSLF